MEDKIKLKISIDAEIFKEKVENVKLELGKIEIKNTSEADIKEISKMLTEKLKESVTIGQVK